MVDLVAMDADPWATWPVDKTELRGLVEEVESLRKALTTRFARSSPVEEALLGIASAKRPLPTREQCGEWAVKLGVPEEYHEFLIRNRKQAS
jgi:hypothetical protein